MTIKDMEARSGMTRANIRFYEAEGLLCPARGANGYRNYSEADLAELKRIRLLRTLRVPLDEIRALRDEKAALCPMLERHQTVLAQEQEELSAARRVCTEICADGAEYAALDAQRYLDSLQSPPAAGAAPLAQDVLPEERIPYRRFFARWLDWMILSTLWEIFLTIACNVNLAQRGEEQFILDEIAALVLMLLTEPVWLALFGTTPGKWVLGLRVMHADGGRLSYEDARRRTWGVLWRGLGLELPVYNVIRLWQSYRACTQGEALDWEERSVLTLRDKKPWRVGAWCGTCVLLVGALVLAAAFAETPRHRGSLTAEEFCENYNRLAAYYDLSWLGTLNPDGTWAKEQESGVVTVQVDTMSVNGDTWSVSGSEMEMPALTFTEQNGRITGISFRLSARDGDMWSVPGLKDTMTLCVLSFAGAHDGFDPFSRARAEMLRAVQTSSMEGFQCTVKGITCTCETESVGGEWINVGDGGIFVGAKNAESGNAAFSLVFSLAESAAA